MRRALVVAVLATAFVGAFAATAEAHPLGNFTVNHYDGLVLSPHGVVDHAVIDTAEIPTEQLSHTLDRDRDGDIDAEERSAYAEQVCSRLAGARQIGRASCRERV